MRFPTNAFLLAAILATSGCATEIPWDEGMTPSVQVGMSRNQVEAAFGSPTREFVDSEGYTALAFLREQTGTGAVRSATELIVRLSGDRVLSYSHSTSSTTTTVTP